MKQRRQTTFEIEDFFKTGFPPSVSSKESKNLLKKSLFCFPNDLMFDIKFVFDHVETCFFQCLDWAY